MSGAKVTGLVEWKDDLTRVARDAEEDGKRIVGQGCNNIKKEWKFRWSGHPHIKHLPRAISYEVKVPYSDHIVGTCGVDKLKIQGPLANIIEYGSVNNAPIPGGLPALAAEEPRFLKFVADMGEGLLQPGGLKRAGKSEFRDVAA